MDRRRLLVVNHATSIGGASLSLEHLLNSIDANLYDVTVYTKSDRSDFADRIERLGYRVLRGGRTPTPFAHYSGAEMPAVSLGAIANMARILRDCFLLSKTLARGYHVVLVNSMTLFWVGRLAKLFRCRTALFDRETFASGRWGLRTRVIKHELLHCFDGVAYISEFDRAEVNDLRPRSAVITDKVDRATYATVSRAEARKMLGLPEGIFLLYVGGTAKLKGPDVVIRAMELMDPRVRLIFLGAESILAGRGDVRNWGRMHNAIDSYSQELRDLAASLELEQRVLYYPATELVHLYYGACDFVVFPSVAPHQARPVYEAGAAGRLMFISGFQQTREHARHGVNCLEFPAGDSRALAELVNSVVADPHACQGLIDENWRMTAVRHDLSSLGREVNDFLKGLS